MPSSRSPNSRVPRNSDVQRVCCSFGAAEHSFEIASAQGSELCLRTPSLPQFSPQSVELSCRSQVADPEPPYPVKVSSNANIIETGHASDTRDLICDVHD